MRLLFIHGRRWMADELLQRCIDYFIDPRHRQSPPCARPRECLRGRLRCAWAE
jgi:hypothetical protein